MAYELAEDVLLADAPGYELAVLRAEIKDQDPFTFGQWRHLDSLLPQGTIRHLNRRQTVLPRMIRRRFGRC
jgi:hypothetical protein